MKALRQTVLIGALSGLLSSGGCALGPDYQRPDMTLPANYPDAGAPPSGPTAAPRNDWWTLFGDAQLNALVDAALRDNSDIRLAAARIEEAEGALREAGAAFYPEIDVGANTNRSRVSGLTIPAPAAPLARKDNKLTASTSYEIDFWGKLRRASEAARAQSLATRYARDVTALTLAGTVTQTWLALRSTDAQLLTTRQSLATREDSLQVVRSRAKGGLASDLDVNQALGARADAAGQIKELQRQRAVYAHQLGALTGRLDLQLSASATDADLRALPMPPVAPAGLPSALLERRPDVRQAEQNLVAANAQIGVAKAAMFPTFSLTGVLGGESADFADLLKSGGKIWSTGFGLSLPIFSAGKFQARTDEAQARERQALASYQKTVETAFREVADALSNVAQANASEADLQVRVDAARNSLKLSKLRYEAGYSAYLDVLDAQRSANDAELALVRNRQARLAYSVDLFKALGGGWSGE